MIFGRSVSDSAVLTASSEIESLPAAAVQRREPRDIWRSTDNANQNLIFDLGAATAFSAVAVLYHNADTSALWRVRTATTQINLTASPTYDSGTMSMASGTQAQRFGRGHSVKEGVTGNVRWVRLDFTTLSGITTLDVGRVMIIDNFADSPSYEWSMSMVHDAEPIATVSSLFGRTGRKYRTLTWSYPPIVDASAYASLGEIDENMDEPVCAAITEASPDDRATDWTVYGYLEESTSNYLYTNQNLRTFTVIEAERP
jgi:hypothetical protein